MAALTQHWRDYFARGKPTGDVSAETLRFIYGLWVVAFLFKHGGAAWDVAWHFRYLFDEFSPPHNVNTVGTALALMVLAYQTWTGVAATGRGLFLIWTGWIFFLVSAPLDILNHNLYGIDLTTWSVTHFMLYTGTTLMLVGVLYSWLKLAPNGSLRIFYAVIIWTLLLDDVMFPLGQQEFGYVAYDAFLKGTSPASRELIDLAGNTAVGIAKYAVENVPRWLYPLWMTVMASLLFTIARRIQGWAWTATAMASLYLAFRFTAQTISATFQFPQSFVPIMILGAALLIDLAARFKWKPILTAIILITAYYTSAAVVGRATLMPDFDLWTAPIAFVLLWIGLEAWEWFKNYYERRLIRT